MEVDTSTALRDDFHFLRLGGKTYTLTETALPTLTDTIETIRSTQERRVARAVTALQQDLVRTANMMSNEEHTRIMQELSAGSVAVPTERHSQPLVVLNSTLCPVRSAVLLPSVVDCSLHGLRAKLTREQVASLGEGLDTFSGDDSMTRVTFRLRGLPAALAEPCLFTLHGDSVYMTHSSFHTLSRAFQNGSAQWHKLCTGRAGGRDFWLHPEFKENINRINCDSFGAGQHRGLPFTQYFNNAAGIEDLRVVSATADWRVS
jgi:hypothetical protein